MDTLVNTNINEQAAEKLKTEMDKSEKQPFAHPILAYLIDRCIEDSGLAEDVMQEHKTWNKCFSYICDQARKMERTGNCVAVEDQTVFEWAEDYYHKDDKAEEEKKAKEAAKKKDKAEKEKKKDIKNKVLTGLESPEVKERVKAEKATIEKKEAPKKKAPDQIDGRIDIFQFLGGQQR